MSPNVVLMDSETEKMGIPGLLEGYAEVHRYYKPPALGPREMLGRADALITVFGKVSAKELDDAPHVRIVAAAAAGYDSVDVQAATSRGVVVTRAGTADVEGVAEHAVGLMLMLSKKLFVAANEVKRGNWNYRNSPSAFGGELFGKALGVVGFGKVGKALGRKGVGLGMNLLVFDPYVKKEDAESLGGRLVSFKEALASSDFLCLTAALTGETKHLVGPGELRSMKPKALLINVARGSMVDQEALRAALTEGVIAGAGLDVLEPEPPTDVALAKLDNCIVTPHVAGLTTERYMDVGRVAVAEVKKVLAGGSPTAENWINTQVRPKGA